MEYGHGTLRPFRFFCNKVLPLQYDDSLSYYELLNKVVNHLNGVIYEVNATGNAVNELSELVSQLKDFVDHYFDGAEMEQKIDKALDKMVQNGTFERLFGESVLTNTSLDNYTFEDFSQHTVLSSEYINTQGMCYDYDRHLLYVTYVNSAGNRCIVAVNPDTLVATGETHVFGVGHMNSLCYWNGYIYGTSGKSDNNYYEVIRIKTADWSYDFKTIPVDVWGLVVKKYSEKTGTVTLMLQASSKIVYAYSAFHGYDQSNQRPLAAINLKYTGQESIQGAFDVDDTYMYFIYTCFNPAVQKMGHQVVRVYGYDGNIVHEYYLRGTGTIELEDISKVGNSFIINGVDTATGAIHLYKYNFTPMYVTTRRHLSNVWGLGAGVVKHAYVNPSPMDVNVIVNDGAKFQTGFGMDNFTYMGEVGEISGFAKFNNVRHPLHFDYTLQYMWFSHQQVFGDGSMMDVRFEYKRSDTDTNYVFNINSIFGYYVDKNGVITRLISGQDLEEYRTVQDVIDIMTEKKLFQQSAYINNITYITGIRKQYASLDLVKA